MGLLHCSPFRALTGRRRWRQAHPATVRRQWPGHRTGNFARNAPTRARNAAAQATYREKELGVPSGESQPRLDLGDLRAAYRHPMRRWAVAVDHRATALLTDESDRRHRHEVAAMDANEQAGIELGLGFRDRPRAHPLAGAVMHLGVMGVGADAAGPRAVDEMGAGG